MATYAHSTTVPARPLLPPVAVRAAPARDARGRFVRRSELPPEPLLAMADAAESTAPAASAAEARRPETAPGTTTSPRPSDPPPPSADEMLDDMVRELDRQGVPRGASPSAPVVRLPPVGASSPGHTAAAAPSLTHVSDPAFAAVHAFDQVVAEWDAEFAEFLGIMDALDPAGRRCWDDPRAVARAVLGPIASSTVAALDASLRSMEALDARHEAAEARLLSTRAASEIGAAALRAAVRRYARRPFGWRAEEAIMLERLAS